MPSSDENTPRSPSPPVNRVVVLSLLYITCVGGALLARIAAGPYVGFAAACGAIIVWVRFGPRPVPGLLPGLMALTVFMQNIGVIVASVVTIVR